MEEVNVEQTIDAERIDFGGVSTGYAQSGTYSVSIDVALHFVVK